MPLTLALGRQGQGDLSEFENKLVYRIRFRESGLHKKPCLK